MNNGNHTLNNWGRLICRYYLCCWKEDLARVAMPGHALFWAKNNFFRQVVNFSEQRLVRKVTVAYFATIAERQTALPWRLRSYLAAYIPPGPREGWTMIRPRWVEQLTHNPKSVCLNFAAGSATYANTIGVRVHTRHLHRCRCLCSSVTLVAAIDTPTSFTQ